MFYDNYVRLCNSIGKSPSAVAIELGLKKATVTRWKKGGNPTDANAQKIADYFNVTTEFLFGIEEQTENMNRIAESRKKKNMSQSVNYFLGTPKENAPSVSDEAMRLAKDYDRLDTWGQKQVRAVADNELARLSASHILRIAGRDGRYEEISIDDEQLEELKEYIRSAPDASDDL